MNIANKDNKTNKETKYKDILVKLLEKYEENPYILNLLDSFMTQLTTVLETKNAKYDERKVRQTELLIEHENFYKIFLSQHPYYYMPNNNLFYKYDGKTFQVIEEDDIHYQLLSTITKEGKFMKWKYKIRQHVLKQIKERLLIHCIPETFTIQKVLHFVMSIFPNKQMAKYFLTVIGDCLLKKQKGSLYFINPSMKNVIEWISHIGNITMGTNINHYFVTKYHENHVLSSCRILLTNTYIDNDIVKYTLDNIGIDLICVATHYSTRYNNGESYLQNRMDTSFVKNICYFVHYDIEQIVCDFVATYIEPATLPSPSTLPSLASTLPPLASTIPNGIGRGGGGGERFKISLKNMLYIWKIYLSNTNIPNMIYSNKLLPLLMTKLPFENNEFVSVTSKYLPSVYSFLQFWKSSIDVTYDNDTDDQCYDEYEIDELITLYKAYKESQCIYDNNCPTNLMIESNMLNIISHYFSPEVCIVEEKYVRNIQCTFWKKTEHINDFVQKYKATHGTTNESNEPNDKESNKSNEQTLIPLDELYKEYEQLVNASSMRVKLIVSKQYFFKYLKTKWPYYIEHDTFIRPDWINEL